MVYKALAAFPKGSHCQLCLTSKKDPYTLGEIFKTSDVIVHYFCLLLASKIEQRGTDTQGILGFFARDIKKEIKRGSKIICSYCKKKGATVSCSAPGCHMTFHVPCGQERGSLHQFFCEFSSFCDKHKPRQRIPSELKKCRVLECTLCCGSIEVNGKSYKDDPLWPTCCKPKALVHRMCLQKFASCAGYYYKCPFCNNQEEFFRGMKKYGIYVPEQEASWETEPNAYSELSERNAYCEHEPCLCPRGTRFNNEKSKWFLEACIDCGAVGKHRGCMISVIKPGTYECSSCLVISRRVNESRNLPRMLPEPSSVIDQDRLSEIAQTVQENSSKNTTAPCGDVIVLSDSEDEAIIVEDIDEETPTIIRSARKRRQSVMQEKRPGSKRQRFAERGAETSSEMMPFAVEEENYRQLPHATDSSSSVANNVQISQRISEIEPQSENNDGHLSSLEADNQNERNLKIALVCSITADGQPVILDYDEAEKEKSLKANKEGAQDQIRFIDLISDNECDEVFVISDADDASSLLDSDGSILDLSEIPELERSKLLDHFSSHPTNNYVKEPSRTTSKPKRKKKKSPVTYTKKKKSVSSDKGKSNKRSIESLNDKFVNKSLSPMKESTSCTSVNFSHISNTNCVNLNHISSSHDNTSENILIPLSDPEETDSSEIINNKSIVGFKNDEPLQSSSSSSNSPIKNAICSLPNAINCLLNNIDNVAENVDLLNSSENTYNNKISPCIGNDQASKKIDVFTSDEFLVASVPFVCQKEKSSKYGSSCIDDVIDPNIIPPIACQSKNFDCISSAESPENIKEPISTNGEINNEQTCDTTNISNNVEDNGEVSENKWKKSSKRRIKDSRKSNLSAKEIFINNKPIDKSKDENLKIVCSLSLEKPVDEIINSLKYSRQAQKCMKSGKNNSEVVIPCFSANNSESNPSCQDSESAEAQVEHQSSNHSPSQAQTLSVVIPLKDVEKSSEYCAENQPDLVLTEPTPEKDAEFYYEVQTKLQANIFNENETHNSSPHNMLEFHLTKSSSCKPSLENLTDSNSTEITPDEGTMVSSQIQEKLWKPKENLPREELMLEYSNSCPQGKLEFHLSKSSSYQANLGSQADSNLTEPTPEEGIVLFSEIQEKLETKVDPSNEEVTQEFSHNCMQDKLGYHLFKSSSSRTSSISHSDLKKIGSTAEENINILPEVQKDSQTSKKTPSKKSEGKLKPSKLFSKDRMDYNSSKSCSSSPNSRSHSELKQTESTAKEDIHFPHQVQEDSLPLNKNPSKKGKRLLKLPKLFSRDKLDHDSSKSCSSRLSSRSHADLKLIESSGKNMQSHPEVLEDSQPSKENSYKKSNCKVKNKSYQAKSSKLCLRDKSEFDLPKSNASKCSSKNHAYLKSTESNPEENIKIHEESYKSKVKVLNRKRNRVKSKLSKHSCENHVDLKLTCEVNIEIPSEVQSEPWPSKENPINEKVNQGSAECNDPKNSLKLNQNPLKEQIGLLPSVRSSDSKVTPELSELNLPETQIELQLSYSDPIPSNHVHQIHPNSAKVDEAIQQRISFESSLALYRKLDEECDVLLENNEKILSSEVQQSDYKEIDDSNVLLMTTKRNSDIKDKKEGETTSYVPCNSSISKLGWYNACKTDCSSCRNSVMLIMEENMSMDDSDLKYFDDPVGLDSVMGNMIGTDCCT